MTVTSVDKDPDRLTLTVIADFTAPVEKVWQLWADPRQLERWWGPPTYPATVEEHDLTPGGEVRYFMTSPEGEKFGGWWRVATVTPPTALEFTDGFSGPDGKPNPEMPTTAVRMTLSEHEGGTRMELRSVFDTREQMEQLAEMGVVEGLGQSIGQMDDLLVAA
ncbi:SRPBCC family protein [Streptomyces incanus]|uniref:SRPBCC domain-containing protein n=1 Tax=Streptomyces incanus TaxID=887453 RepID=A0ABW0XU48_9ACTN